MNEQTKRAIVYIDGFNLYHAIDNLKQPQLKWLSLNDLSLHITRLLKHDLIGVQYFSAYAYHRSVDSVTRHKVYVEALKSTGVTCVLGKFKEKPQSCRECSASWRSHEEKETDVNLALHILKDGLQNNYDIAYLISGDSDLAPAFKMVKELLPHKRLVNISPPARRHSKEILVYSDNKLALTIGDIFQNMFPDQLTSLNGKTLTRPKDWRKPKTKLLHTLTPSGQQARQ